MKKTKCTLCGNTENVKHHSDNNYICEACDMTIYKKAKNRSVINCVTDERSRQDAKWGEQNHEPPIWLGILGEEFGELCQAINETVFDNGAEERKKGGYENMRKEAIQIAAVAVAFVECLDRKNLKTEVE